MNKGIRWQVVLLSAFVLAVSGGVAPARQRGEQSSPDRKALNDANAIKDPAQKIAALEKFLVDSPDSNSAYSAHLGIFDTLVKNYPAQEARILEQAGKAIDRAPEAARPNLYNTLGNTLCDGGILLEEAGKFTAKGLALTEEELARTAKRSRAAYQATLGRIYLKRGMLDNAEKDLKLAVAGNAQLMAAYLGLAELYDKRGDSRMALATYITGAVSGKMPAADRARLNSLYAKGHNGSTDGLEEMLDKKYIELNPPPFAVERYRPSAKRTDRAVLTEVFTGSGCPPCVAADLAADLAMERYNRDELVVLMYHQHVPQPDPMTTPQTQARFRFYSGTGVPTVVIDGHDTAGGGSRDAAKRIYDGFSKEIESRLEVAPGAALKLTAVQSGSKVSANAVVSQVQGESSDLKLHIVLAEGKLRYTGENGVRFHPMVVRSMAATDDGPGFAVTSKDAQSFAWDFDLAAISDGIQKHLDEYEKAGHRGNSFTFTEKKSQINPKDLFVAAFVQDDKTKEILQTIIVPVTSLPATSR